MRRVYVFDMHFVYFRLCLLSFFVCMCGNGDSLVDDDDVLLRTICCVAKS